MLHSALWCPRSCRGRVSVCLTPPPHPQHRRSLLGALGCLHSRPPSPVPLKVLLGAGSNSCLLSSSFLTCRCQNRRVGLALTVHTAPLHPATSFPRPRIALPCFPPPAATPSVPVPFHLPSCPARRRVPGAPSSPLHSLPPGLLCLTPA